MKGYKNTTKTVYKTESSDYDSGYRSGKEFYSKSRAARTMTPSEKGGVAGKLTRGATRAMVVKPVDAVVKALSYTGTLTDNDGTKASPTYVKGLLQARKDVVGYAKGGKVAAKVGKVMGEFKAGALHSGSKKGPAVTNRKQAIAIGLSEARKAGAKIPMRKAEGGAVMDPGGYRIGGGRGTHRYAKDGDGWRMDASEFKVLKDITARDLADIERGKRPGASKLDKMAAAEAERRQNRQGYASEGYDEDTGIGLMRKSRISDPAKRAASDAVRPKVYKAEGGKVKAPPPKAKPDIDYIYRPNPAAESVKPKTGVPSSTGIGAKMKQGAAERAYDPVKDEPTSRPLTADQVRNLRNQMKAPKPPAKRAYDPVLDEPTSRPFKTGGYVKKQAGGLMAERELGAREMVGKAKGGAVAAVHKHERNMHPGKPLTKMRYGGKVGC